MRQAFILWITDMYPMLLEPGGYKGCPICRSEPMNRWDRDSMKYSKIAT